MKVEAWGIGAESARADPEGMFGPRSVPNLAEARTGPDGRFELAVPAGDTYTLRATQEGWFQVGDLNHAVPPRIAAGDGVEHAITLDRFEMVWARAVDEGSGEVLTHAAYLLTFQGQTSYAAVPLLDDVWNSPTFPYAAGYKFFMGGRSVLPGDGVRLSVSAPGYASSTVAVPVLPWERDLEPTRVRLRKLRDDLHPTRVELRWADGRPVTAGTFMLTLRGLDRQKHFLPVRVRDGELSELIPLPAEETTVMLIGGSGSTTYWHHAIAPKRVSAQEIATGVVRLTAGGGGLCVCPLGAGAAALRHFWIDVEGTGTSGGLWTWNSEEPFQRGPDDQGIVLWLPAGRDVTLRVRAHGFSTAKTTVRLEDGGRVSSWSPVLTAERGPETPR